MSGENEWQLRCDDPDCPATDPCPCRPGVLRRDLLMGIMPAFYVGKDGICTHRLSESDTPVYCRNRDDAMFLMDICWAAFPNSKQENGGNDASESAQGKRNNPEVRESE